MNKDIDTNVNKKGLSLLSIFFLLILCIFTCYPMTSIYHTMWDNIMVHLWHIEGKSLWEVAKDGFETMNGRPTPFFAFPADMLMWVNNSKVIYQVIKIFVFLLGLVFFSFFIAYFCKSKEFAYLCAGIFLISLQNLMNFDLVNCFSVSLHLPLIYFFLSCILVIHYFEKGGFVSLFLSSFLFLMACLAYESFLLFFIIIIFLGYFFRKRKTIVDKHDKQEFDLEKSVASKILAGKAKFFRMLLLFTLCIIIYLLVYFIARSRIDTKYVGTEFALEKSELPLKVYSQYTLSAMPMYHILNWKLPFNKRLIDEAYLGKDNFRGDYKQVLENLNLLWIVKGVIAVGFIFFLLPRIGNISFRYSFGALVIAILLISLPNILVAISQGHQRYFKELGFLNANTTYYCNFGWVILLSLGLNALYQMVNKIHRFFGALVVLTIGFFVFILSVSTDFWNYHVNWHERVFYKKWILVDNLINSDEFSDLPNNSVIFAPSLYRGRTYWEKDLYKYNNYWQSYFRAMTGKNFVVEKDVNRVTNILGNNTYFFEILQNDKNDEDYTLFANVSKVISYPDFWSIYSRKSTIFVNSKTKRFVFQGKLVEDKEIVQDKVSKDSELDNFGKGQKVLKISNSDIIDRVGDIFEANVDLGGSEVGDKFTVLDRKSVV